MIAERRKNFDYNDRVVKRLGGNFSPFIMSTDGLMGFCAKKVVDAISNKLAACSMEKLIDIKTGIKTMLAFA